MGLVHTRILATEIWEVVAGEAAGVGSVRLHSNVSNYYTITATGNAYGLRTVGHRGTRPPR